MLKAGADVLIEAQRAEYGTSSHAARPYMTVANEKAHEKVVEAQRSIWESETGE